MPTVPSGTQFIGAAANQDLVSKKSALASEPASGYTIEDIAAKVAQIQATTTTTTTTTTV